MPENTIRLLMLLLITAVLQESRAADVELTGYAAASSDYVFRGVSYSDGHASIQGGADFSVANGFYAGLWASSVDITNGDNHRSREITYYAGYMHPLNEAWSISATAVAYTFPGARGRIDYDFEEIAFAVNYRDVAWIEYAWSPDLYNTSLNTHSFELYAETRISDKLILGGGLGYYDTSSLTEAGYGYWQVGVTRPFERFSVDLRLHDTNRAVRIVSTAERAEARVALTIRVPFTIWSQ